MKQLGTLVVVVVLLVAAGAGLYMSGALDRVFSSSPYDVSSDGDIDAALSQEITARTQAVLQSIQKKDKAAILQQFVKDVADSKDFQRDVDQLIKQVTPILERSQLKNFHQFHITVEQAPENNLVVVESGTEPPFTMGIQGGVGQYVVNLVSADAGFAEVMFGFIYVQTEQGWRVRNLDIGDYKVTGRSFVDWVVRAKDLADQDRYVPALLNLQFGGSIVRPTKFMEWTKALNEARELEKEVAEALKAISFPVTLERVETKPKVFYIIPQLANGDLLPEVQYLSQFKVPAANASKEEADKLAQNLKAEAAAMHQVIDESFEGLSKMSTHVIYRAFDEPPVDPKKQYQTYSTVIPTTTKDAE